MATLEAAKAEITEWLNTAVGVRFNPDQAYGLQCVDPADAFAETIFGVPWSKTLGGVPGARALMDTANHEFFEKIWNDPGNPNLIPQAGDIIIWGGSAINQWGHVAITISAIPASVNVLQQDGFAQPLKWVPNPDGVGGNYYSDKPAHTATLGYTNPGTGMVRGWLRPRPEKVKDTGALARLGGKPKPTVPVNPAPQVTPGTVMHGIDIASHQTGINLGAVPADFVIIKATSGTGYRNPAMRDQVDSARKAGRLTAFYHYAHERGFEGTPEAEADHFVNTVKPYLTDTTNLVLDWEEDSVTGNNANGVTGNVWAKRFLDRVKASTGRAAWLYARLDHLNAHGWETVPKAHPLWLAWYGGAITGYANDFTLPFKVPAGFRLAAWQYSEQGTLPGWGANLDLNVFFGDATIWRDTVTGRLPTYTTPGVAAKPVVTVPAKKPSAVTGTIPPVVIVEAGDTLTSIAAQFGTTLEKIKTLNPGINPDRINVGQAIRLTGTPTAQAVVEAGDTLTSIAAQFGTTVEKMKAANPGINPDRINVGQVINLPGGAKAARPAQVVVEAGDTLTSIASQFGTTVASITAKNPGINPNIIHPGQTLNI